jgi:hypothetical protein
MASNVFILVSLKGKYKIEKLHTGSPKKNDFYPLSQKYSMFATEFKIFADINVPGYRVTTGKSKLLGLTKIKYDDKELNIIATFDSGALKDGIEKILIKGPIELNNFIEISHRESPSGDYCFSRIFPDQLEILVFPDKKTLLESLKSRLTKDELSVHKDYADKQSLLDTFYTSKLIIPSLENIKKIKTFKDEFLEDKMFVTAIIDSLNSSGYKDIAKEFKSFL